MLSIHLRKTSWLISLLIFASLAQGYDEYDQSSIFPELVSVWQAFCEGTGGEETFILTLQAFIAAGSVDAYKDTLDALAERGLRSSKAICRKECLKIYGWFYTAAKHEYMRNMLSDSVLRETAAAIIIQWGDWDLAAPILADYGRYGALGRDPRAIPFLEAGVVSPDPKKRFSAALFLRDFFGDDRYILPVMRGILSLDPNPMYLNLKSNGMAILRKSGDPADLSLLADVARSNPEPGLRQHACLMVLNSAQEGNLTALDLLFSISENSIDMSVREQAAQWHAELSK